MAFLVAWCGGSAALAANKQSADAASSRVSFAHEVRPVLAANCFACHGPDEASREADLRLDERSAAIDYGAIVPGDADGSLLVERITASDPDLIMPPPDSGFHLDQVQIELLTKWIEEGAEYAPHWSYVPLERPPIPTVNTADWPLNEIDFFVLRRLEDAGLKPAREADPRLLLRRVSLDLIGLPPSPEQAEVFAADPPQDAYERIVDELLASPHFGEHWARVWLDLARYADTKGYEKDLPRQMWPYRDWLIRALNSDMPLDQFTIEQLAGDLLPHPSPDQRIATAFHRNTMTNDEGGTDDEEFRVAAVKDRVDTTLQVWMGLTAGCAKCHSHKFDPISHEEYYKLYAIFNQSADRDAFDDSPVMRLESPEQAQELRSLQAEISRLKGKLRESAERDQGSAVAPNSRESNQGPEKNAGSAPSSDEQLKRLEERLQQIESTIVKLPIISELRDENRRVTRIHLRGNFLDQGDEVLPGVPGAFGETGGRDFSRLEFAKWLMSPENPLTARVAANRVWARFFGVGIVETEGDFGAQGALPTHPSLLDWLASELRDAHRWSLKEMCKSIVLSRTYRQSSFSDSKSNDADPQNRLFSRGPRFRLPAETVRDQALAASGLLSKNTYGPPVMPPQPPGIWKSIYNKEKWQTSEGQDRYRRALYTYWKRTSPYPSMLIFDAETREICSIRRIHTNTPLQALVLMNDPVYLEAAAALAKRMIEEGGAAEEARISRGFRLVLIRPPLASEVARLQDLRRAAHRKLADSPGAVAEFLESSHATCRAPEAMAAAEFASYIIVASAILNLDEAVTRN